MPVAVALWDETVPGDRVRAGAVTLDAPRTTARALIAERIRQEVERYNRERPPVFQGLVQPSDSENILNGYRLASPKPIDSGEQLRLACRSFESNGFLLLVDGRQVTELDAEVDLRPESEVDFVKLVPLIGG
ncbi:MAG: hypothetical protein R2729_23205 [Bryobacteraceae bacterium]